MARIRHDLNTIYISGRLQESLRPGLPLCADGGRCTHGLRQDDGRQLVSRQRGAATLYPHQRLFRPPCHSLAKRAGGLCPRRVPVPA